MNEKEQGKTAAGEWRKGLDKELAARPELRDRMDLNELLREYLALKASPAQKKPEVPQEYDLVLPGDAAEDKESVEGFKKLARELGLSREQAQGVVDFHASMLERRERFVQAMRREWMESLRTDPDWAGENFDRNIHHARTALKRFGNEGLYQALELSGYGDHPELARFLANVGRSLAEEGYVRGRETGRKLSDGEVLYPNQGRY